jgi:uncharacterized membrane protein
VFVGALAVTVIISMLLGFLTGDDEGFLSFILTIVGVLIQWWMYLGLMRIALAAYDGQSISVQMLFGESWKTLLQYAIAAILTAILTFIGLVLIIVPGIIVSVMLSLAPFILLDRHVSGIEAMKESRRLTRGHRMNLFLLFLLITLLNIAGLLVVGVGLLVSMPVSLLAFVYAYKQIEKGIALAPQQPAMTPPPATA